MRPGTLAEVALLTQRGDSFDRCLANFLDGFYADPTEAALAGAPHRLGPEMGGRGWMLDAYLAATAEQLAGNFGFKMPGWVLSDDRKLDHPWFASNLGAMRAVLLLESPAVFRARNLFISANALSRA